MRITTEDSYFVLDGDPDRPTEKETFPRDGALDLENFRPAITTPLSVIPGVAELLLTHLSNDGLSDCPCLAALHSAKLIHRGCIVTLRSLIFASILAILISIDMSST